MRNTHRCLRFLSGEDVRLHMPNRVRVGVLALAALLDHGVGRLEEPAVLPDCLAVLVAGEVGEARRSKDDGEVVFTGVDDDEGARRVDGSDVDLWVGSGGDTSQYAHKVETAGRVEPGEIASEASRQSEGRWIERCRRCFRWEGVGRRQLVGRSRERSQVRIDTDDRRTVRTVDGLGNVELVRSTTALTCGRLRRRWWSRRFEHQRFAGADRIAGNGRLDEGRTVAPWLSGSALDE